MPKTPVIRWLSRLRVGQKIGLSYALSLSLAVSGAIAGIGIGNYYSQESADREEHARNEVELLHRLQTEVLQIRTHQQQLIPLTQVPPEFNEEYRHIQIHSKQLADAWEELKSFVHSQPPASQSVQETHTQQLPAFAQTYEGVPEAYLQALQSLVAQIHRLNLTDPAEQLKAQQLLLNFTNSNRALKFDGISDDLTGLLENSYTEADQAEAFQVASNEIAQQIFLASVGLSVGIAVLLAILTSRAIASPIQGLTRIAKQSTEESNFDLQAPIESHDEIGTLAQSFNQLIHSVKQLLADQQTTNSQLGAVNQTLEQRVEERTQELSEKNTQLQNLLEQLRHTQVQIIQSEKMSSLGQLVAGVAHEINNPVNFIYGNLTHVEKYAEDLMNFVQLYQKYYPDPIEEIEIEAEEIDLEFLQEDLPKLLNSMQIGADRIRQIVLSLRNFSRMDESEFKAINIHEGIDSTLMILQHRLKAKTERPEIQVIREYGNLPLVECYPGQLNQVFMNILANAIDALEQSNDGRTYQEIQNNPNKITIRTVALANHQVEIAIADNGPGIPADIQPQIFNPFFTTKPVGQGTGMGMAISYQIIVEKHGGTLQCASTPGEFTRFTIQIPVTQQVSITA